MNKVALSLRKVLHYNDCPTQKPKFIYFILSVLNLKLTDTDPPFLEMILMSSSSSLPLVSYSRILTLWYCGPVVTGGTTSSLQVGKFSRFIPSSRGCWGSACNTQKQRKSEGPYVVVMVLPNGYWKFLHKTHSMFVLPRKRDNIRENKIQHSYIGLYR